MKMWWEFIFNYCWLNENVRENGKQYDQISLKILYQKTNSTINSETQFNSYKYESVYSNNSLEFNFNLKETYDETENSDNDSFKSCESTELYEKSTSNSIKIKKSKPIDIKNYSNSLNSYVIVNSKENEREIHSADSYIILPKIIVTKLQRIS